jgi:hypothetical protein
MNSSSSFSAHALPRYEDVAYTNLGALEIPDTMPAVPQYTLVPALASQSTRYGREFR